MNTPRPDCLPQLVLLEDYGGNWERYLSAIYVCFRKDFVENRPLYKNVKLSLKRHPVIDGKEVTFWHLISEGLVEEERFTDLRRCERIRWPRPIIEHSEDVLVKTWENIRGSETRICIWLEDQEYLVVLAKRKTYILFWTAYPVTRDHRKRKLQKEYEEYWKMASAAN